MRLDRERLIKLLNLTGSENDAEALSAIRRSNVLLRRHRTTWAELLAPSQQPLQAPEPGPAQARPQRPRPSQRNPYAFSERPTWEYNVRYTRRQRYWTASETIEAWGSVLLGVMFFPVSVFTWLYTRVERTRRQWPGWIAMLVPIFGGGVAATVWVVILLSVAVLIG
jgi:hypothetical protein